MRKTLRNMLADNKTYLVPGVFDCLGAKTAEKAGLQLVFVTGNGLSAAALGMPDVGVMTMREVVDRSAYIAACIGIPVIGDADTGYGSILNTIRTVQEFERAGLAGIFLEDQVTPKQCAYYPGAKYLITAEEHAAKIKLASKARVDNDFSIIARTDAFRINGIEDAIRRAQRYQDAGADAIFSIGLTNIEMVRTLAAEISIPLIVNVNDGDPLSRVEVNELNKAGVKFVFYPATVRSAVMQAMMTVMTCLKQNNGTTEVLGQLASLNEFNNLLNVDAYIDIQNQFIAITHGIPDERGEDRDV